MKKIIFVVVALVLLIAAIFLMSRNKPVGMPMPGMGKMGCPMMGKAQMVATDEGGVIVLAGNRLIKYDADLNLVKEIGVQMPMPMGGKMGGKQCPMMGNMAEKDFVPPAAGAQEKRA